MRIFGPYIGEAMNGRVGRSMTSEIAHLHRETCTQDAFGRDAQFRSHKACMLHYENFENQVPLCFTYTPVGHKRDGAVTAN
ncbi:predicted protein [Lichtheimia corymbifera JMRC:FSU:9682]|uniref:Uncharacterized protein n=1 Tax=Lichtheimia corymbifera JMRC:FSU:9682 TaxID=1263082 RepID=A0A068RI39_9FUNG|nr:predicted protein [Lichtheimia corymbifera JMRC:FSU:9682]